MTPIVMVKFFVLAIAAIVAVLLYFRQVRERHGLTPGETLDLDEEALHSDRFRLAGRPNRTVREKGIAIPEEWKSSPRVYDSHRAQMGVYFILRAGGRGDRVARRSH